MTAAAWHRRELGWLRADGEVFLERGAPMSDTGHPAWLVWIRAVDSEVEHHEHSMTTSNGDPVRPLAELLGTSYTDTDGPWFIHRGDEGWLADAKAAADYHLAQRDAKAAAQ